MGEPVPRETFGELVRRMRMRARISATELGRRVGRDGRSAVEAWERGDSLPARDAFPVLAAELGIPLDHLLTLAGVELGGDLRVDPVLAGLADQAGDMERKLRALATRPPESLAALADVVQESMGEDEGGSRREGPE
jgi:transcriptional regulator with XRE-family HTH domain